MITTEYANQIADEIVKAQNNGLYELGQIGVWFLQEKIAATPNLSSLLNGANEQVQRLIADEKKKREDV